MRTDVASPEFTDSVCVNASVINWLLDSRQSPTVEGMTLPLLATSLLKRSHSYASNLSNASKVHASDDEAD